jgi:co-chaperonin GroES (HSP10)
MIEKTENIIPIDGGTARVLIELTEESKETKTKGGIIMTGTDPVDFRIGEVKQIVQGQLVSIGDKVLFDRRAGIKIKS